MTVVNWGLNLAFDQATVARGAGDTVNTWTNVRLANPDTVVLDDATIQAAADVLVAYQVPTL